MQLIAVSPQTIARKVMSRLGKVAITYCGWTAHLYVLMSKLGANFNGMINACIKLPERK